MASNPIPFRPTTPGSPGNRYGPADREAAFQHYRKAGSYRRTADHLGIAASTIEQWGKQDGWAERARQEAVDEAEANRVAISGRVMPLANDAVDVLDEVMKDKTAPAMARVKAAVEMLGIAGIVAPREGRPLDLPKSVARIRARDLDRMTDQQLAELERELTAGEQPPTDAAGD